MRAINKPHHDVGAVFAACIGGIQSHDFRGRLEAVADPLFTAAGEYDRRAEIAELYTFAADLGENDDIILGNVSKKELKSVYTQHMVAKTKRARDIYQELLNLAPLGICPLCGFCQAETLDHYLPKAGFPQFSVLPFNLIPACWSCNHGKLDSTVETAGQQPLHPYYDHAHFISDQWLFADVQQSAPVSVKFLVSPPALWDNISKERVVAHFKSFELPRKYSVQATGELSTIRYSLATFCPDEASRKNRLTENADAHYNMHRNSWQTALYQALARNDWYCREGFDAE
jgi:5-methylcytosine-specific restriction endonuclease McrA